MATRCVSSMFYCDTVEYDSGTHYFLDSCSLCKKPLSKNRDIFMYRGDTPFCSEECRQEQMEIDQEREFRRKHRKVGSLNGKNKGSRRDLKQRQEDCDSNQRIPVVAGVWQQSPPSNFVFDLVRVLEEKRRIVITPCNFCTINVKYEVFLSNCSTPFSNFTSCLFCVILIFFLMVWRQNCILQHSRSV